LFTTARVELVFAARLFVEQVDAGEEQLVGALVPAQNVLCAVAVVHVQIHDGDAVYGVGVLCEGVQSANHDAVENAKATRDTVIQKPVDARMVPWRAYDAEGIAVFALQHAIRGVANRACGTESGLKRPRGEDGVGRHPVFQLLGRGAAHV